MLGGVNFVTVAGVLVCAMGAGFVASMQAEPRLGKAASAPVSQAQTAEDAAAPVPPLETPPVQLAEIEPLDAPAESSSSKTRPQLGEGPKNPCEITASAEPEPNAHARIRLIAPCHPNLPVTLHHDGLVFADRTDAAGGLELVAPGLSEYAVYILAFANGDGAVAQTRLPDVTEVNRVVLLWQSHTGFELHAHEFGAAFGSVGHVYHGVLGAQSEAGSTDQHGYLVRYGNPDIPNPYLSDVYSFPKQMSARNGQIDLSVELHVTAENCGQEATAQTLEHDGSGEIRHHTLSVAVPDCAAIGTFLVLNNVFDDLKVAAR